MTITDETLMEIQARVRAATAGTWVWEEDFGGDTSALRALPAMMSAELISDEGVWVVTPGTQNGIPLPVDGDPENWTGRLPVLMVGCADADFIVHARDDVIALLAEVNRLRELGATDRAWGHRW